MTRQSHREERAAAPAILLVDDDVTALRGVRRWLRLHGMESVLECTDSREVPGLLERHPVSLVLLDLNMPHERGEQVLDRISAHHPDVAVIVVTANDDARAAVSCMKQGAVDYLVKPVDGDQLVATVHRALEQNALRFEASRLREQFFAERVQNPDAFREIVTAHPKMMRLFAYLEAVSRSSQPALIVGETGTGKELLAAALHRASGRAGPFVAVNVAGLDDEMFSDTLFGHEPGAFTGAQLGRAGMIERAGTGTLFLDEIGDLSEASQVKLLRLLQEHEYYPLGSDTPRRLRARVISATHKDTAQLRQDLYYRLRSYCARVPPLRERLADLPLLTEHFLEVAAQDLGKSKPTVPAELYVYLQNHAFPGNVRELRSIVFDAVARHDRGVMALELFLHHLESEPPAVATEAHGNEIRFPFPMPSLKTICHAAVDECLQRADQNRSAAARMLGISRPTILRYVSRQDDDT